MLQDVFNAHPGEKISYRSRMVAYKNASFSFPFSVLTTRLEMVSDQSFSEVLYARDALDIIGFYLRECLIRQLTARRCKHCGRWFFLTGHLGLVYCERTDNGRGRTCREIGASAPRASSLLRTPPPGRKRCKDIRTLLTISKNHQECPFRF